jgi:thioredoxin 1
MIAEINSKSFERQIQNSKTPVVVEVWAPWCGPCKAMAPALENVAKNYTGKIQVLKLNADNNQELLKQLKVIGIPTMLFYSHGKLIDRKTGMQSEQAIINRLEPLLELTPAEAADREITGLLRWPRWVSKLFKSKNSQAAS